MKRALKAIVVSVLAWQVRRLQRKNNFKCVAVAGSYGKTSTKLAIVQALQTKYKVRFQDGNYNDITTVPLIFFGRTIPPLFNPFAWLSVFLKNELALRRPYDYDVVVVELGIDGPRQMQEFKKYLKVDLAQVTSIAPEHMEFFDRIEDVAKEELAIREFSDVVLVNKNLCDIKLPTDTKISGYEIEFNEENLSDKWSVKFGAKTINLGIKPDSITQLYTFANAAVVCVELGMTEEEIKKSLLGIDTVPGRMNRLEGKGGSRIIDDTYNASPDAVIMALHNLYAAEGDKKIALLGNMNELGEESESYHRAVGKQCDPKKLDLVVTLGPEANKFLADEARKRGCKVVETTTPYEAAERIEGRLGEGVVVLAKGSQNGVFAEEAIKLLLADPKDAGLLVRQSPAWIKKKEKSFKSK
jgi:UDP-N-acetylmuramoyl-tripeptide--D-alanyl-D-alanine ligase